MAFRIKNGRITMKFDVDEAVLKKLDSSALIKYKGSKVALKDLYGDVVIDIDDITIAQIAWILKNREVMYLHMEKTKKGEPKMVAIGIEKVIE